jgi:hypothetical protein
MPGATRGAASIDISASAILVYDIASDVTRIGDRSTECDGAVWLDGASRPAVGARFRGHNHLGPLRWSTVCEVTSAMPGEEFAFTVVDGKGREQTRWRYLIEQRGDRTRLTETYEFLWCPLVARLAELPIPRDRQLMRGVQQTIAAVKRAAEHDEPRPDSNHPEYA